MENIFEDRIIINDSNNDNLFHLIKEELSVVPLRLIRFVFERGFKIYYIPYPNNNLKQFFVKYDLDQYYLFDEETLNQRNGLVPSHVQFDKKAIIITANGFLKTGYPHSIAIHEFSHAIDYVLSDNKYFLHKYMPQGKPLDDYAATNMFEKFAVAFEAFCHPEGFCGNDYRIHNKLELFKKSPDIFKFLDQLFREWKSEVFLR